MSMTLLEQMKSSVSQQSIGYAAKLLGESPANIEKAVSLAVPMLLSAIASAAHVSSGTGGQSVVSRLVADPVNDGSLLHRLPALYQGTMTAAPVYRLGAQLLQAVFGAKLGKVTQTIAALSGVKPASSALLVNTLAPHVLAILGKRHRLCGDATPHGLINLLDTECAAMTAAVPGALAEFIPAVPKATTAEAVAAAAKPSTVTKITTAAKPGPTSARAAAPPPASSAAPKHEPYVKPPIVTKQSYQWSSWLPVIALYGAGAAGLAMFLTSQTEIPGGTVGVATPAPTKTAAAPAIPAAKPAAAPLSASPAVTKPAEIKTAEAKLPESKALDAKPADVKAAPLKTAAVKPPEGKPADVKPAETKAAAAKPSDAKPEPTAAAKSPGAPPTAPGNSADAPKIAAAAPAKPTAEDISAEANPYKPPVAAIRAATEAAAPKAEPAPVKTAAAAVPPAGTTSYFGTGAGPAFDTTAKANPDYKPAEPAPQAPAAAPQATAISPPSDPSAKTAAAQALPAAAPSPSGTTSFFGTSAGPAFDTTAKVNPDYKPAAPATAEATIVVQPPPAKGTTTFFGATPPVAEAPAKANPDYKPAASITADVAPAAAPPATTAPAAPPVAPPAATAAAPPALPAAPVAAAPATAPAQAPAPVKPAATAVAPPPAPSLATQALSAVKSLMTPAPVRQPGVTSYFGSTPPVPEAAARLNPDYVPSQPAPSQTATAGGSKPQAAADAAAAGPAAACKAALAKATKGGRIAFQSTKADLRPSSIAVLDRIAATLKTCPNVRVTIEGHTDNTGKDELNQKLSLARAQSVSSYLATKGVDAARVSAVGAGSARPLAPNTTAVNKARNRRIEFSLGNS